MSRTSAFCSLTRVNACAATPGRVRISSPYSCTLQQPVETLVREALKALAARFGGSYSETGEYPAWEYQKDSRLREVMVEVFEAQYGRKPVVEAIHAGLECGIFSDRLPGLDAVSFGPQMHDIHTSREKLDIASTARTWEYLVAVLERL